jgi:hypothetical protein
MKIKVSWIATAVLLVTIGGYIIPRWKYWYPAQASAWEPARVEQASPESTVNLMFRMTDQYREGAPADEIIADRLNNMHMLEEKKDRTPEEQKFVDLFLDNQRGAAIYTYLRHFLATSASITATLTTGDATLVSVDMKVQPDDSSEWVAATCTVNLKKRGPNWYVDELKTPRTPEGVYRAFKARLGSMP